MSKEAFLLRKWGVTNNQQFIEHHFNSWVCKIKLSAIIQRHIFLLHFLCFNLLPSLFSGGSAFSWGGGSNYIPLFPGMFDITDGCTTIVAVFLVYPEILFYPL